MDHVIVIADGGDLEELLAQLWSECGEDKEVEWDVFDVSCECVELDVDGRVRTDELLDRDAIRDILEVRDDWLDGEYSLMVGDDCSQKGAKNPADCSLKMWSWRRAVWHASAIEESQQVML